MVFEKTKAAWKEVERLDELLGLARAAYEQAKIDDSGITPDLTVLICDGKEFLASEINVFGAEDDDPRVSCLGHPRKKDGTWSSKSHYLGIIGRSVSVKAAESKGAAQ